MIAPLQDRVLEYLCRGEKSPGGLLPASKLYQIAEDLGITKSSARYAAERLVARGLVARTVDRAANDLYQYRAVA